MKVHHLNCSTMCPAGGRFLPSTFAKHIICHCLLVESSQGLVLVDTGHSLASLREPKRMGVFNSIANLQPRVEDAAINQVQALGFKREDVRHIIPTHLDIDHAEGIVDFPTALIHTSREEYGIATRPRQIAERFRYKFFTPGSARWHLQDLTNAEITGEDWFGFKGVRALVGSADEILMIPLFGHSRGHFGVAVRGSEGWMLHAGDAYYSHTELTGSETWDLKVFKKVAHSNLKVAAYNVGRLQQLKLDHPEIKVFCAHDPAEFPT